MYVVATTRKKIFIPYKESVRFYYLIRFHLFLLLSTEIISSHKHNTEWSIYAGKVGSWNKHSDTFGGVGECKERMLSRSQNFVNQVQSWLNVNNFLKTQLPRTHVHQFFLYNKKVWNLLLYLAGVKKNRFNFFLLITTNLWCLVSRFARQFIFLNGTDLNMVYAWSKAKTKVL